MIKASIKNGTPATQCVDDERIHLLFKETPMGIGATVFSGLVCAYLLRSLIHPPILLGWVGSLLAVSLIRCLLVIQFNRHAGSSDHMSRYKIWNISTLAVSGIIWGSSAIFLFPEASVPHQFFLAIITVGMVAVATLAFTMFQSAILAYALPVLLPISIRYLATPTELHRFTGILGIFLLLLSLNISRRFNKTRLQFLYLRKTLAEQVAQQTETLRRTNERLQLENKKRAQIQVQLEETRKFEAIANLAGGIAHQFNNALAVIVGNIELLLLDHKNTSSIEPCLGPIRKSAGQMSQLTSQLLAYAKGGKYKPQIINVNDFIQTTLSTIHHSLFPELTLTTKLCAASTWVEIDLTQLQMVISAIIANSAEATDPKGIVRVSCHHETIHKSRIDRCGELQPGEYAVMTISDNGVGMTEETQQRIFEPFFTTKFHGRGLGMAAVFGIIQNHQGHISISSRTEEGTQVSVYLPICESPMQTANETAPEKMTNTHSRVLLIEDEKMVMAVNQKILERLGYTVIPAHNGNTAIELIRETKCEFDLVLIDLKLPDMDGSVIFPIIRRHRPAAKVIICSGYDLEGRTQALLDQGADGFIQKPFTLEAVAEKFRQVLTTPVGTGNRNAV